MQLKPLSPQSNTGDSMTMWMMYTAFLKTKDKVSLDKDSNFVCTVQ